MERRLLKATEETGYNIGLNIKIVRQPTKKFRRQVWKDKLTSKLGKGNTTFLWKINNNKIDNVCMY